MVSPVLERENLGSDALAATYMVGCQLREGRASTVTVREQNAGGGGNYEGAGCSSVAGRVSTRLLLSSGGMSGHMDYESSFTKPRQANSA